MINRILAQHNLENAWNDVRERKGAAGSNESSVSSLQSRVGSLQSRVRAR